MIAQSSVSVVNIDDGNSVEEIIVEYAISSSADVVPGTPLKDKDNNVITDMNGVPLTDGSWSTSIPQVNQGEWLYTRTRTIYTDGQFSIAYNVSRNGEDGAKGDDGVSIQTEKEQWYLSDSDSQLTGGSWSFTEPSTIPDGKYLWGRWQFTMSDGSIHYSDAVYRSSISGVTSLVDEVNKKITQKIWATDVSSSITEYDNTTGKNMRDATSSISDRVTETETDISGIKTSVSSINSSLNQKADGSTVTALETRVSTAEQSINGFKTEVANTYVKSTTLNGELAELNDKIDDINVGARNLIKNTLFPDVSSAANYPKMIGQTGNTTVPSGSSVAVATHGMRATVGTARYPYIVFGSSSIGYGSMHGLEVGETYTLSFDATWKLFSAATGSTVYYFKAYLWDNHANSTAFAASESYNIASITSADYGEEMTGRCEFTFTVPENATKLYLAIRGSTATTALYSAGDFIEVRNIKLERGNRATDWTPAPEDLSSEYTDIRTIAEQNADHFSWLVRNGSTSTSLTLTDSAVTAMTNQFIVKDPAGSSTVITGGKIQTGSLTTNMLASDIIKSNNYSPSTELSSPYTATGTFLDLANGNFWSQNFGIIQVSNVKIGNKTYTPPLGAWFNGTVYATAGRFGDSNSYWNIETVEDYNQNSHAALVATNDSYLQTENWQINRNSISTQKYVSDTESTGSASYYKDADTNTFYDVGMKIPTVFTNRANNEQPYDTYKRSFFYGRKYTGATPPYEDSDWTYLFQVDTQGNIYECGQPLNQRYAAIGDAEGKYVSTTGGTVNGNLTVTGTLAATANAAKKVTSTLSVNGKTYDGSSQVTVGTIGVGYGGTGATTLASGQVLIGNGTSAVTTRAIRNNTSTGTLGWTSSSADNTLITTNTLAYWNGQYRTNASNLEYVKLGKLGTVVTHDVEDFITTSGGIIDGSLQVTDLTAGDLVVTGAGRFTNGLYGNLTGDITGVSTGVKDSNNGTKTTFAYSKSALTTASYLAAWNGYELRAISPANVLNTIGAMPRTQTFTQDDLVPISSKTYTQVIASANDQDNGALYFMKVMPTSYNGSWSIKYRVYATIEGVTEANGSGFEESIVEIYGMRNTYSAYHIWNNVSNTSYRPYYYHCIYRAKEAGITGGYGHALGVHLRYSWNPTAYTRTVTFEILKTSNCTVTLLDSPLKYAEWPGNGTTNYDNYTNLDATTNGMSSTGDRNDVNYYNRNYYGCRTAAAAVYRYQLCLTKPDRSILPINSVNNSIETNKTLTTEPFDPFGDILYWSSTTSYAAGANVGDGWYAQYLADIRYSFNIGGNTVASTLVGRKPLYLVATPLPDGTAVLHSEPLAQTLPTSDNGLIYIYLGQMYPDTNPYRLYLTILHPIYWYKDGAVRKYLPESDRAVNDSDGNKISTTYLKKSGDKMTGALTIGGHDLILGTPNAQSNDSADIVWLYGDGSEKMRLYAPAAPSAKIGPMFRMYNSQGNSLYSGYLPLADGTSATGTWGISITGSAATAGSLTTGRDFTIGKTTKSAVKWDSAVSFTQAEISDCASNTANGWMSSADKKKLDSITVSDIGSVGANSIVGEKDINVSITNGIATVGHSNTAITAGTVSGTSNSGNVAFGSTVTIPSITYDAYGHITGATTTTFKLPATPTTVSGNAGTATKFSSNRTIALTGDVTGSASTDGSNGWSITTTVANSSHNHVPSNIIGENDYKSGDIDLITGAYIGSSVSNKSFGLPADAITIEYSRDGGSTWLDYEASDIQKKNLFMETRNSIFYLGKGDSSSVNNVNNCLRVTIEPTDRYTSFHGIYVWLSKSGNTLNMKLECSTIGAKDTFTTIFSDQPVAGGPGSNIRYFPQKTFGGGATQINNQYKYRITFYQTAINSSNKSGSITDIRFIGKNVWTVPNNMVKYNHLYSWDTDFNAIFPAKITATEFTGNATSATIAAKTNALASSKGRQPSMNIDFSESDFNKQLTYMYADSSTVTNKPPCGDAEILNFGWDNGESNKYGAQLALGLGKPANTHINIRGSNNGTWTDWRVVLDSTNYNDYAPSKTGTGASGTWGISISGNAATATSTGSLTGLTANSFVIGNGTSAAYASSNLSYYNNVDLTVGSTTVKRNGIHLKGTAYGNTASQLVSQTAGVMSYGDGGPQLTFCSTNQYGAIIFTDHDSCGSGVSWHFVSDQSDWNVNSKRFVAKTSVTIGANKPNTSYPLHVTGNAHMTGAVTGGSFAATDYVSVNSSSSGTSGGLSLYGTASPTYHGIAFRTSSNSGTHGYAQGNWSTYFYITGSGFDDTTTSAAMRGWIFKNSQKSENVASISGLGHAVFNGSVTVGGNATNTSGMRMEFDDTLQCTNFIFN